MKDPNNPCLFCNIKESGLAKENDLAYASYDSYPVAEGHCLVIPKRHVKDYFELVPAEVSAINNLMAGQKELLQEFDSTIDGFNIGMNCGETAGQTVFHCHVHLIPRRIGDVDNPRGGVRHIISGKGFYEDKK